MAGFLERERGKFGGVRKETGEERDLSVAGEQELLLLHEELCWSGAGPPGNVEGSGGGEEAPREHLGH